MFERDISEISSLDPVRFRGRVREVHDLTVEVEGFGGALAVGDRVRIDRRHDAVGAEVVGAHADSAVLMLHGSSEGVSPGNSVVRERAPVIRPCEAWLGRVVDASGAAIDGGGQAPQGDVDYHLRAAPPPAALRRRMRGRIETGLRAFNTFLPVCKGQRMGIFAGSGVGKSTLLGMVAANMKVDVIVVGLVGERGREVNEFVQDVLGAEGLQRSVVVAATSDEPALVRRDAAYAAMATTEFFRDQGLHVLCLLDSVTRFALAQREIGLAAGEPPSIRAYPPSVFSRLSGLLERAGPGWGTRGDVTGLFTVLVEGSDHDEPISDAVRGIIDGHVVLDRQIAEKGRFPAIDMLRSVSRSLPGCHGDEENALLTEARRHMRTATDMEELTRIGAYQKGSNPEVDRALAAHESLEKFVGQSPDEFDTIEDSFTKLSRILAEAKQRHPER